MLRCAAPWRVPTVLSRHQLCRPVRERRRKIPHATTLLTSSSHGHANGHAHCHRSHPASLCARLITRLYLRARAWIHALV